jgi:hypothetical protein
LRSAMSQEARDKREREKLYAAIESSSTVGRQLVDLDGPSNYSSKKTPGKFEMNGYAPKESRQSRPSIDEEHARDARDEATIPTPSISRPESPFTQHPTIDFDGLSWPSKCSISERYMHKLMFPRRRRNSCKTRCNTRGGEGTARKAYRRCSNNTRMCRGGSGSRRLTQDP